MARTRATTNVSTSSPAPTAVEPVEDDTTTSPEPDTKPAEAPTQKKGATK